MAGVWSARRSFFLDASIKWPIGEEVVSQKIMVPLGGSAEAEKVYIAERLPNTESLKR